MRIGTAESVTLAAAAFDLAVAATSAHWLDLDVVLPAVHRALVADGHLAFWRNAFGDPEALTTPFRERVASIVARRDTRDPRPGPGELDTDGWVERLSRGGLFTPTHVEELRWSTVLGADQVRDLFLTFSDWAPAEAAAAARAVDHLGGRVVEHYVTPLVVLRRAASPS